MGRRPKELKRSILMLEQEQIALDENGVVLPRESYAGTLAVYLEEFLGIETKLKPLVTFKLNNGHFLHLSPAGAAALMDQVCLSYPEVFFNHPRELFDFILEKNLPIAVKRTVEHGLGCKVFWRYSIA